MMPLTCLAVQGARAAVAAMLLIGCTCPPPTLRTMRLELERGKGSEADPGRRGRIIEVRHQHDPAWLKPYGALVQAHFFELIRPRPGGSPRSVLRVFDDLEAVDFVVEDPPTVRWMRDERVLKVGFAIRRAGELAPQQAVSLPEEARCWIAGSALERWVAARMAEPQRSKQ